MREGIYVAPNSKAFERRFKRVAEQSPRTAFNMIRWTTTRAVELTIEKLGGPVLRRQTGVLMGSIHGHVAPRGTSVNASVYSTCVYARIHELGGTIRPKSAQYLRFQIDGAWKTVSEVTIPERPYIRPSVEQALDEALEKEWWKL